jgi:assimilatory nitrate reductase catalytic subunit
VPDESSMRLLSLAYWSVAPVERGYELSFVTAPTGASADTVIATLLNNAANLTLRDEASKTLRAAAVSVGRIEAIAFASPDSTLRASQWLKQCFAADHLSLSDRRSLLAGIAPDAVQDGGPIVCVCHQVSSATILDAITKDCTTTDAVGRKCRAGTNCGSCLPEISRMLKTGKSVAALA